MACVKEEENDSKIIITNMDGGVVSDGTCLDEPLISSLPSNIEIIKKCSLCGSNVPLKRKDQNFCSTYCKQKTKNKEYYHTHKDEPSFIKKRKQNFRKWYGNNKEKQKIVSLKNYQKDKRLWDIRGFNNRHKDRILNFLEHKCFVCNKPTSKIIYIKDKEGITVPTLNRYHKTKDNLSLKEYAEKYLAVLCSVDCLGKTRRI